MTVDEVLSAYHYLDVSAGYASKAGLRFNAVKHIGLRLLQRADLGSSLIDATGSAGYVAWRNDEVARATVLEASAAALRCAKVTFADRAGVELSAGAPWDLPAEGSELLCLLPATDRGTARVRAELQGAHRALREGGSASLVMHKDQGAKRYERVAGEIFGELEVVAKDGGWRLSRAFKRNDAARQPKALEFEAAGLKLEAEPGVFAAGKLDPGTALLLAHTDLTSLAGLRVLDLGCGYGLLALKASLAGAEVTACDDDLLAVRSTYRNARRYGLDVRCLHSDVNSALKRDERFDVVLTNPPFHVGKEVRPRLSRVFLAAAIKHLRPGGTLMLVANQALAYERELALWAEVETIAHNQWFKVLRAVKR